MGLAKTVQVNISLIHETSWRSINGQVDVW